MTETNFDVLIVGAGLSGIGAAVHLQNDCPGKTYAILEKRGAIGGTWDLFRYPGIRSDSDMHTLGYVFKPWLDAKVIADGPNIRSYVRETADEHGITPHIRFNHGVVKSEWSSSEAKWTVTVDHDGTQKTLTCNFLFMCSGYYNYDAGYTPDFAGRETFKGQVVHPQKWTEDIDYAGKKVVVIGSGATAVTLVPEMAKTAAHVTMLQRSPTYIVSRPAKDRIANFLRKIMPESWAYGISRWKNITLGRYFYRQTQAKPEEAKKKLLDMARKELGEGFDIETDFTPRYNPWEQRLCLVPDSDLFHSLKSGAASVKTDHIDQFVPEGIKLKSGDTLEADLIVTATGLDLQLFGGMDLVIDGEAKAPGDLVVYRGLMYGDVPNFANVFGYTNASWTLKADLTCHYVCRLLNHMDETGTEICVPNLKDSDVDIQTMQPLDSGYFIRAADKLPKEGTDMPWQQHHDYVADTKALKKDPLEDGAMQFKTRQAALQPKAVIAAE